MYGRVSLTLLPAARVISLNVVSAYPSLPFPTLLEMVTVVNL